MILYILSLLIACFLYINAPANMDKGFMTSCLGLVGMNLFYFVMMKSKSGYKLKKIFFRHSFIFLFCFIVVFFQYDLDFVIGLKDSSERMIWIDTTIVCKALALSSIALYSLLIGYDLLRKKEKGIKVLNSCSYLYQSKMKKELCYIGYFFLFLYLVFVPRTYLYGGYNAGYDRGEVNVILVLLQALFIAVFALYCYEFRNGKPSRSYFQELKAPIVLIALYITIVLLTGRRTEAIRMSLLMLIAYSYAMGRKTNNKVILVVTVAAAVMFSVTRVLRSGDTKEFGKGVEIVADSPSISPFTQELSSSVNTLHVAVSNFPNRYDFNGGLTFFPNFFVLVPGLDRFYQSNIRGNGVITNSAEMITNIEIGSDAGYGMGSSIVADVFIAFGPIGVVITFLLLGVFIRYLEVGTFALVKSPYFLVLSLGCCSQFMFACRGTVANLFLSWSYATILVFLFSRRIKKDVSTFKNI